MTKVTQGKAPETKPIHVRIPANLYSEFRIKLFKEGKSIKQKIMELIQRYVNE